jgi:hypothetical protein
MQWGQKRTIYLLVLCAGMLALALLVYVRNRSPDDDLLASMGIIGGLAILIVALPGGNNEGG